MTFCDNTTCKYCIGGRFCSASITQFEAIKRDIPNAVQCMTYESRVKPAPSKEVQR